MIQKADWIRELWEIQVVACNIVGNWNWVKACFSWLVNYNIDKSSWCSWIHVLNHHKHLWFSLKVKNDEGLEKTTTFFKLRRAILRMTIPYRDFAMHYRLCRIYPVDTGRKLNVQKMSYVRSVCVLYLRGNLVLDLYFHI